jgi:hypothetical protein
MASLLTHPTRIIKTRDVIVRLGVVDGVNRPNVNYKEGSDMTELYRINNGRLVMYEFQGATTSSYQISDDESTFRYIGDSGWTDGVITNSRVQTSITANFLKSLEWTGSELTPHYYAKKGELDEAFNIVAKFRNNKDFEAWVEIYKLIDTIEGGVSVYDVASFAGTVMNYQEQYPAEGLVESSFDVMSRGEAYMGRYQSIIPMRTGLPNQLILPPLPAVNELTGATVREVVASVTVGSTATDVPLTDTLTSVAVTTDVTFTYEDGSGTPLTSLVAGATTVSKPLARIVDVETKLFVPATVTVDANAGTIVVAPASDLTAGKQYYAEVLTGAMLQTVNSVNYPLQGLKTGVFTTAV